MCAWINKWRWPPCGRLRVDPINNSTLSLPSILMNRCPHSSGLLPIPTTICSAVVITMSPCLASLPWTTAFPGPPGKWLYVPEHSYSAWALLATVSSPDSTVLCLKGCCSPFSVVAKVKRWFGNTNTWVFAYHGHWGAEPMESGSAELGVRNRYSLTSSCGD